MRLQTTTTAGLSQFLYHTLILTGLLFVYTSVLKGKCLNPVPLLRLLQSYIWQNTCSLFFVWLTRCDTSLINKTHYYWGSHPIRRTCIPLGNGNNYEHFNEGFALCSGPKYWVGLEAWQYNTIWLNWDLRACVGANTHAHIKRHADFYLFFFPMQMNMNF